MTKITDDKQAIIHVNGMLAELEKYLKDHGIDVEVEGYFKKGNERFQILWMMNEKED